MEVGIKAIGTAVPQKVLSNFELEKMVDTSDEWITSRTGIKERHILNPNEKITGFAVEAAQLACNNGGQAQEKIDFIISSTVAPDRICPAQSYEIAHELKTEDALCFDINTACTGFIYGLGIAESLLKTRKISNGIVSAAEQLSRTVDYTDRSTCILFGDAAAAVLLTNEHPEHILLHTELGSDPSMSNEVIIGGVSDLLDNRRSDYYFWQNGRAIMKFAVKKIKQLYETVPAQVGIKPDQIRYVIPHQANARIIDNVASEIGNGKTEFLMNIERYGNTSSVSIPLVLAENWSRFEKDDYILLIGFGGGLSWGATLIQW
jgi:3-oxoacyl-[acyl-carrier-protein] synthase III